MFNLAILQARMSSTRLPGKVLLKVNGKELLQYECERILKSKYIDKLVLATSVDKSDDPLTDFAKTNDLEIYRGSLDNVLSRYYNCALEYVGTHGADNLNIIRLTGDCPIIDFDVIDEIVNHFQKGSYDYCSNTLLPTYPDGLDAEIFTFSALEHAFKNAKYKSDKEHVTLFIKNSDIFKKKNIASKHDFSHLRFTVDEEKDYLLIKNIIEALYTKNPHFTFLDVISYLSKNPELFNINSDINRDEGLLKSLKNDGRI